MKWGDEEHLREIEDSSFHRGVLVGALIVFVIACVYILQLGAACGS